MVGGRRMCDIFVLLLMNLMRPTDGAFGAGHKCTVHFSGRHTKLTAEQKLTHIDQQVGDNQWEPNGLDKKYPQKIVKSTFAQKGPE